MDSPAVERDKESSVTRSQHVLYTLPPDRGSIPQFMLPLIARVDRELQEPQLLVVTPDDETALSIVSAGNDGENPVSVLPVSSSRRAARLLRARPAQLIAGDARALLELVQSAALKLDTVRGVVLAWADHIYDANDGDALEALLGEAPKDGARVLVIERNTPEIDSLVERQLRRPRRVEAAASPEGEVGSISYVVAGAEGRARALRRVLEELDPATAAVVVSSDEAEREARSLITALGRATEESVRVTRDPAETGERAMVVFHGLPSTRETLVKSSAGGALRMVAIVEARQIGSLRAMTGGTIAPLAFPAPIQGARKREQQLRDELRAELARGVPSRELLTLEPLLSEFDGSELAAAALRLLEKARAAPVAAGGPTPISVAPATSDGFVRVFLTVGSRDGATPGAIVGAVTGESGIRSTQLGKIDIREAFSLVEVSASDAEAVIRAMNGAQVSGRRVAARLDREGAGEERGARPSRGGSGGPPRGGPRGAPRGGPRDRGGSDRPRGGPRGAGPSRGPSRDREDRGPRRDKPSGPRGAGGGPRERDKLPSDREQWTSRGDAMRHSRRPPQRTDREDVE